MSVWQVPAEGPVSLSVVHDSNVDVNNDATTLSMPVYKRFFLIVEAPLYLGILPSGDLVIHSSNMTVDCDAGDNHYHYGTVLAIEFLIYHGYCCGNVNNSCDLNKVNITVAENGQGHCYCVGNHDSEDLQD